jgi:hypothetical protein
MGLECKKSKVKGLLMQDIIVCDEINKNIEKGIDCAAAGITESLQGKEFVKGGIEKIDKRNEVLFKHRQYDLALAKIG